MESVRELERPGHLRSAARWRLLGLLFECPRQAWWQEMRALAVELKELGLLAAVEAAADADEAAYLRMFGPGGAISPREAGHRPMADPGAILAELTARYQAFAYRPGLGEPFDHVAVELGYLGYLELKAAFAQDQQDCEAQATVGRELDSFAADHVSLLVASLKSRLAGADTYWSIAAASASQELPQAHLRSLPILEMA